MNIFSYYITSQTAKTALFLPAFFLLSVSAAYAQTTRYVTPTGAGTMDGSSWPNASSDFQAMINASASGDAVWVAAGTYKPTKAPLNNPSPTDPRDKTFFVKDGIQIYGGFAGTETLLSKRNIVANVTTLSGDFNGDDVVIGSGTTLSITGNTENAYHVVATLAPPSGGGGVTIDGFIITGGNANGSGVITINVDYMPRGYGGGIIALYGTNNINNNTLIGNSSDFGGGMALLSGTNTCTHNTIINNMGSGVHTREGTHSFSNNTIVGNENSGMKLTYSINTLIHNTIYNNVVQSIVPQPANASNANKQHGNNAQLRIGTFNGGGVFLFYSTNTIINNTLYNNSAPDNGGGIYSDNSSSTIINNTFYANSADNGGAIYTKGNANTLTNNIFWDNLKTGSSTIAGADIANGTGTSAAVNTVTYCLTQQNSTYSTGTGMINNQNPIFVNAADSDGADNIHRTSDDGLQLQPSSPCINIGNNPSMVVTTDITGADRIQDTTVDLGAYERVPIICGARRGTWAE